MAAMKMGSMQERQPLLGNDGNVALAYAEPLEKRQKSASNALKITLISFDCLFLGLQPVLVHMSKNSKGQYSFSPVAVNFMVELAKTIFAIITLLIWGTGRPGVPMYRSLRSFFIDALHNKLLAGPALLYAINNYLKFTMQLFFKPVTTKMLGNLKVFTIALLMRAVMHRRFTVIQWEALFLLVAGITVNQLNSHCPVPGEASSGMPPLLPAVLCTLGTVTVPSAASVYNEFALKRHMETSVLLQNFFLYFYGMVFNLVAVLAVSVYKGQGLAEMFAGQSLVTLLLIANNAAQGILSSFFYKFADTILKKYSSTIATIWTALMSWALFGHALTVNFLLGVSIVFISMHQFFTFNDKNPQVKAALAQSERAGSKMVYSPSLEHIAITSRNGSSSGIPMYAVPRQPADGYMQQQHGNHHQQHGSTLPGILEGPMAMAGAQGHAGIINSSGRASSLGTAGTAAGDGVPVKVPLQMMSTGNESFKRQSAQGQVYR